MSLKNVGGLSAFQLETKTEYCSEKREYAVSRNIDGQETVVITYYRTTCSSVVQLHSEQESSPRVKKNQIYYRDPNFQNIFADDNNYASEVSWNVRNAAGGKHRRGAPMKEGLGSTQGVHMKAGTPRRVGVPQEYYEHHQELINGLTRGGRPRR